MTDEYELECPHCGNWDEYKMPPAQNQQEVEIVCQKCGEPIPVIAFVDWVNR